MAPRRKKTAAKPAQEKKPPLTLDESKSLKGSLAELEGLKKAKEESQKLRGLKSVEDVLPTAEKPVVSKEQLTKRAQRRSRKQPTVRRGPGGRMESVRTQIAPLGDAEVQPKPDARFAAPGAKPRKGRTRSGKKIDKITGKVVQPTVKRDESGRAVGLSEEERKAAVTTVLPEAGPSVMQPKPAAQPVQPIGTLKRGGQRGQKGFAGNYQQTQKAVHAALYHLNNAHFALAAGMPHEEHLQNFDAIHANIKDKHLHKGLGIARHLISVSGGKNSPELTAIHNIIKGRLEEGRIAHEENVQRAMAGREKNGS